ncbi:hypothetical protein GCM10009841_03480 [Microlunatus panaciterrae]|uniref:Immunity protein 17 n=1 Tax=Microlunatus panaciterrae TaxID=400768 RepID=A0ABS2RJ47_9ACTN|nr:hypothetical protein [Microlunatus panaciterrae]MBM7798992.1 hypothetical protein [Microlunatus panaciterrae]
MYEALLVAGLLVAAVGIYIVIDATRKQPRFLTYYVKIRANRGLASFYGGLVATIGLTMAFFAVLNLVLG